MVVVFYLLNNTDDGWWRCKTHMLQQEKIPSGYKEKSVCNSLKLKQIMQWSCVISIPEDLHTSLGEGSKQPDITLKLALLEAGRWTCSPQEVPSKINLSVIL